MTDKPASIGLGAAIAIATLAESAPALAYVGPGAGLSVLGALWGVLAAVVVSLLFIVVWPIRRAMKRRRQRARAAVARDGQVDEPQAPRREHHADGRNGRARSPSATAS